MWCKHGFFPLLLFVAALLHTSASKPKFLVILEDSTMVTCQAPHLISCKRVNINFEMMRNLETLEFPGGVTMKRADHFDTDEYISISYRNEKGDSAMLTFPRDKYMNTIHGTVRYNDGEVFALENCGSDCHSWELLSNNVWRDDKIVRNDKDKVKCWQVKPSESDLALLAQGIADNDTVAEISFMIYFTKEFRSSTRNIKEFINKAIAEMDEGFKSSKIPLKAKLFCAELAVGFPDEDSFSDNDPDIVLNSFVAWKNGDIPTLLNTADVALLLTLNGDSQATLNNPSKTVGYVAKYVTLRYYAMGHDVGHMFGAHHNRGAPYTEDVPYPYGYGYLIQPPGPPEGGYHTIMAYPNTGNQWIVNYYSSSDPTVKFMNMPTGNAETDNARVFRERRFLYNNIGNEAGTCSTTCASGEICEFYDKCTDSIDGVHYSCGNLVCLVGTENNSIKSVEHTLPPDPYPSGKEKDIALCMKVIRDDQPPLGLIYYDLAENSGPIGKGQGYEGIQHLNKRDICPPTTTCRYFCDYSNCNSLDLGMPNNTGPSMTTNVIQTASDTSTSSSPDVKSRSSKWPLLLTMGIIVLTNFKCQ